MNKFTKKELAEVYKLTRLCGRVIDGGYRDKWVVIGRKIVRASTQGMTEPDVALEVTSLTALRKEYKEISEPRWEPDYDFREMNETLPHPWEIIDANGNILLTINEHYYDGAYLCTYPGFTSMGGYQDVVMTNDFPEGLLRRAVATI